MKRIPLSFLLLSLFSNLVYANDSLPDANKKVLEYANAQIGKKIRAGYCFDFVKGALDIATPGWNKRQKRVWLLSRTYEYVYGKKIKREKLLPGDIIYYKWKSTTTSEHSSHVCIVYSIDKGGIIKVVEQNTKGTLKKSIVEINNCDLTGQDWDAKVYHIRFYRPY